MISSKTSRRVVVKFLVVGSLAFITNYLTLEFFINVLTFSKVPAAVFAMLITIHMTFILHNIWTYRRSNTEFYVTLDKRYLSYLSTNSTGAAITIGGFSLLSSAMPNFLALGSAALAAMIWNFLMNLIVWRHNKSYTSDIVSTLQ